MTKTVIETKATCEPIKAKLEKFYTFQELNCAEFH